MCSEERPIYFSYLFLPFLFVFACHYTDRQLLPNQMRGTKPIPPPPPSCHSFPVTSILSLGPMFRKSERPKRNPIGSLRKAIAAEALKREPISGRSFDGRIMGCHSRKMHFFLCKSKCQAHRLIRGLPHSFIFCLRIN